MKTQQLTDIYTQRNDLLAVVKDKINNRLVTRVNYEIRRDLDITLDYLDELLIAIQDKIWISEQIYYTYLETINQTALNGAFPDPHMKFEYTFYYNQLGGSKIVSISLEPYFYKHTIDNNFQQFILLTASLYENLVRLIETLLKKTIVHPYKQGRHDSTPLKLLIDYRKVLIQLDYRNDDEFNQCLDQYQDYFSDFLPVINGLRNSYIHGYQTNLISDGSSYKIFHPKFTNDFKNSARLEIDVFSKEVKLNTVQFVKDLLSCLTQMILQTKDPIPL